MDLFDEKEILKKLTRVPHSNRELQAPAHARIGNDIYLSYYVESFEENWSGKISQNPTHTIKQTPHSIYHFHNAVYFASEMYEDDILESHRLYKVGLRSFNQYRVENSKLVDRILTNYDKSIIKQHVIPKELKHFVFTLHGFIVEVVCSGFDVHNETGSITGSIIKSIKDDV